MLVSEALQCLGSKRAIWIDDLFTETPRELAEMLIQNREVALACEFTELEEVLQKAKYGEDAALNELVQVLQDLSATRRDEIKQRYFTYEAKKEFSKESIEKVCALLGVDAKDRWTFDEAAGSLGDLCKKGDNEISYIVDLSEAGGSRTRGLEILKILWEQKSEGTAFILTHEAEAATEALKERELREQLLSEGEDSFGIPICVIAKDRIFGAIEGERLNDALKTSIKRAGLRRGLSKVISVSESVVRDGFRSAATKLLSVPPEQLEAHVFERGYKEGVSELHVVERILSSQISTHLRMFFGTDSEVQASTKLLRSLRAIELAAVSSSDDQNLAEFRLAEIWESPELINASMTPIACGDVFQPDPHETKVSKIGKKFIVLAQPCDIALRPAGPERAEETAFFVPLIKATDKMISARDEKQPILPCKLEGHQWACDFRNVTAVRVAILDLASFRADGRLRVDEGHVVDANLLAAQIRIYEARTRQATAAINDPETIPVQGDLQLTFSASEPFTNFQTAVYGKQSPKSGNPPMPARPNRVTWQLQRCGRLRMPYSAALLDQYLSVMSRQAFDMDYMAPGFGHE